MRLWGEMGVDSGNLCCVGFVLVDEECQRLLLWEIYTNGYCRSSQEHV